MARETCPSGGRAGGHPGARLFAYLQQLTGLLWTVGGYRKLLQAEYGARAPEVEARYPAALYGSPAAAWAALVTDEDFACPTAETARLLAPQVPLRVYLFDDTHAPSRLPHLPFFPRLGAHHASEIAYLLRRPWIFADPSRFDGHLQRHGKPCPIRKATAFSGWIADPAPPISAVCFDLSVDRISEILAVCGDLDLGCEAIPSGATAQSLDDPFLGLGMQHVSAIPQCLAIFVGHTAPKEVL